MSAKQSRWHSLPRCEAHANLFGTSAQPVYSCRDCVAAALEDLAARPSWRNRDATATEKGKATS